MSNKIIAMSGLVGMYSSMMPIGAKDRIIGWYNPETDKKPERNSMCPCGSGKKFTKCCINKGKDNGR